MKKFLFILQIILKLFLIFLVIFIWARYFIKSLLFSLLLTIVLTAIIYICSVFIEKKISNKRQLKIKEKEEAEDLFLSIATQENSLDFFFNLAKSRHQNTKKCKDYILIDHGEEGKVILYPVLSFLSLNSNDIAKILSQTKKEKAQKIVITCGEIEKNANSFAKNFDIKILLLDKFATYSNLYKEYNIYPEKTMKYKKEKSFAFKELLALSFNRSRTKGYILSAFILFLSSLIIRPSIYYCIIASLLLIFALVSFINPYYNVKISKEIL